MTKNELNQLYWLNKETAQLQRELSELRQKSVTVSPVLTGMPKGSCNQDQVGDYISEIMILEESIKLNLQKIYYERNRLERYIAEIPDSEMRLIMRLRHVNGMTFEEIGWEANMGKSTVHRKYNEYFKEKK